MIKNRMSVATIDSPEFVNITSMSNPLISKCEVKVLYIGENRNRSYITKDVAAEMAKTLPGCPIVGYYIESKEDFGDHGDQMIIDGEGVKFNKLTKPYGFVAPDSKVWFQKFEDTDEFGNTVVREYLMTEGYLWTGQFEEAKRVIESGNPQSMELDEKTLKGYWSTDNNKGIDFFIINDAIFSKLCILGEDVEPCFEGADVTAPKMSTKFSKDDNFSITLFSMMEELKSTLQNEGGQKVANQTIENINVEEKFSNDQDKVNKIDMPENENITGEFKAEEKDKEDEEKSDETETETSEENKEEEDEKDKKKSSKYEIDDNSEDVEGSDVEPEAEVQEEETPVEPAAETAPTPLDFDGEEEKNKKSYALLETELEELKAEYSLLQEKCAELESYKASIEDAKKDELINSFYMLSDEDKADVIENKAQYSLDDIEAKLSVICVRKKVNFDLNEESAEEQPATTFNLNSIDSISVPAYVSALRDVCKNV